MGRGSLRLTRHCQRFASSTRSVPVGTPHRTSGRVPTPVPAALRSAERAPRGSPTDVSLGSVSALRPDGDELRLHTSRAPRPRQSPAATGHGHLRRPHRRRALPRDHIASPPLSRRRPVLPLGTAETTTSGAAHSGPIRSRVPRERHGTGRPAGPRPAASHCRLWRTRGPRTASSRLRIPDSASSVTARRFGGQLLPVTRESTSAPSTRPAHVADGADVTA